MVIVGPKPAFGGPFSKLSYSIRKEGRHYKFDESDFDIFRKLRHGLRRVLPGWAIAILNAMWAEYSFRTFKPRIVRHRYGPYDFQVELIDFDGASWFDRDYDQGAFAEIAVLKRHKLRPGAKAFNLGANQCIQAMMMAKELGPDGVVWAVEPNPWNVRAGLKNCEPNGVDNVRLIEAAASSKLGQIRFNSAMNGHVAVSEHEAGTHLVEAVTIDDLSSRFGAPDVLYIDVEGFECEVLEGAKATLALHTPDCFVEVHLQMGLERYGASVGTLLSLLPLAGTIFSIAMGTTAYLGRSKKAQCFRQSASIWSLSPGLRSGI